MKSIVAFCITAWIIVPLSMLWLLVESVLSYFYGKSFNYLSLWVVIIAVISSIVFMILGVVYIIKEDKKQWTKNSI